MSHKRVASLYLRANAPLDKNFKLSFQGQKLLDHYFSAMASFLTTHLDGHSLEAMSWFVESLPHLNELSKDIVESFNKVDGVLKQEENKPDAQKHSKQLKAQIELVRKISLNQGRINVQTFFKKHEHTLKSLTSYNVVTGNKQGEQALYSCLFDYVALLQNTTLLIEKTVPQLQNLADMITTENAQIASEEIQGGGVGGFFKKLFRRAGLTLESSLTEPLLELQHKIHALGVDSIHPNIFQKAVNDYYKMASFEQIYQDMMEIMPTRLLPEDKPFLMYIYANYQSFSHYHKGHMNLVDVAADSALIHVAQINAQKIFKTWLQVKN
jgi:hypothetical protein